MKKRTDGLFQSSFTFNGRRFYAYGHTRQECEKKEQEKLRELINGKEKHDNPTLNQYYEMWMEARRGTVKDATLRCQRFQYETCANVEISLTGLKIGDMKLKEITPDDIREVQRALVDGSGNAAQTVNDKIAVLSHIFNTAIKERRLDYNPCIAVKSLKRTERAARDTIHRALTQEEQETFFREAENSFYYDTFRMAALTGMRCGEIGALYLSDISGGMINIERTITKTEYGYIIGDDAKTWHGRRKIPVNEGIKEVLEHQKEINKMLDGDKITSITERVFKAPERGLLLATPADREINRICKRTGIEKFTMHALRATFATRCIEQGMDVKTLQEILGHSDYGLTMNLYGHVVDDTKRKAMERLKIVL